MYVDHRLLRTKFLPLFRSGVVGKSVSRSVGSWNFQGTFPIKKNTAQAAQRWILSGWIGGKMNRVCCGAVNLSGMIHGEAVFKMNTTTSCGKVQTNPQEQWDLQEKYHCVQNSSRGFWKIYDSKVERVGLILSCNPCLTPDWSGSGCHSAAPRSGRENPPAYSAEFRSSWQKPDLAAGNLYPVTQKYSPQNITPRTGDMYPVFWTLAQKWIINLPSWMLLWI